MIIDRFQAQKPLFSFEFFPPKNEEGQERLMATVTHLAELEPDFVSVTYGAGGSSRDLTVGMTRRIKAETGIEPMAHLTCVGHSAAEIREVLDRLAAAGVTNVLALRGDPPKGAERFEAPPDGFAYASELASMIRDMGGFCIAGACYPETHVDNPDPEDDLARLKHKVDQGAQFLISQLFFDNAAWFRFMERTKAAGITVPILPGIMPVTNVAQVERFTKMCGATIPEELARRLDRVRADDQAVMATGIEWAIRQCRELLAAGAPGIHFYTLNKSLATRIVCLSLKQDIARDVPKLR